MPCTLSQTGTAALDTQARSGQRGTNPAPPHQRKTRHPGTCGIAASTAEARASCRQRRHPRSKKNMGGTWHTRTSPRGSQPAPASCFLVLAVVRLRADAQKRFGGLDAQRGAQRAQPPGNEPELDGEPGPSDAPAPLSHLRKARYSTNPRKLD